MHFMPLEPKPFHELAQVALGPSIRIIGFTDKSNFHEKWALNISPPPQEAPKFLPTKKTV
jgi:hypothetical protein